jgi:phosphoglycolate phosphatase
MPIKAVLFDLDGTLLDTLDDLADSMNAVLAGHHLPVHPVEAYKYFVGDGISLLVERTLPASYRNPEFIATCVAEMGHEYNKRWASKTKPYDGIIEVLKSLHDHKFPLAILSNKPDEFTRMIAAKFFHSIFFSAVQGAKPHIPKKPDPMAAFEIALVLGIEPADFLYVGDTNTDMKTAVAAGMYPLGVTWGFRDEKELLEYGARSIANHPHDIMTVIKSIA